MALGNKQKSEDLYNEKQLILGTERMKTKLERIKLNNGVKIPALGIGTWQIPDSEDLVQSLENAIRLGYRYLDTAAIYENENSVGEAIRRSEVKRSELFVSSKCWAANRTYDSVMRAFEESLRNLKLDYLDCYLIHWPYTKGDPLAWQSVNIGTWRAFEKLYEEGLVKAIGISNFQMHHLVSFLARANVVPAVNQLEFHPGYTQRNALAFCKKNGITVEAWSPLGHGSLLDEPLIKEVASHYDRSVAQVILRWCRHHDVIPVTRALTPEHQAENLESFDFELTQDDIDRLDRLPIMGFSGLEPDHVSF